MADTYTIVVPVHLTQTDQPCTVIVSAERVTTDGPHVVAIGTVTVYDGIP